MDAAGRGRPRGAQRSPSPLVERWCSGKRSQKADGERSRPPSRRSLGTSGSAAWQSSQVDGWWVAALPEAAGQVEEALALTLAAHHDARQDAVDQRSPESLVATAYLAGDDRRPQHLLGVVVGGRHLGIVQEHQPF